MCCFVYVLGSHKDGKWRTYVGWTNDLTARLDKHNTGIGAKSTRGRFWEILYVERYFTRREAMSREWYLKKDRNFRKSIRPF